MTRKIVLPGDLLASNPKAAGYGTYVDGGKVYARVMGLFDKSDTGVRVIPLKGKYIPAVGDIVIGIVREVTSGGWMVDIYSHYSAFLPFSENPDYKPSKKPEDVLDIGDAIVSKVLSIDPRLNVTLSMRDKPCRPVRFGRIVAINPARVPRVIGKKGSMIKTLKSELEIKILVGQNGLIWLSGDKNKISYAEEAIYMIEEEAHTEGLTDRIVYLIKNRIGELEHDRE